MRRDFLVSRVSDARGAVLIEFAFSLPLLLLLVVGIIDFGFMFRDYLAVTNAAREGARMAVLPADYALGDVQGRVEAYLAAASVAGTPTVTLDPLVPPDSGGPFATRRVTVRLDRTFWFLGPIAALFGGTFGTVTLTATSEMRLEVGSS